MPLAIAGRADDRHEELDGRHLVAGFLGRFALRALNRILARFESARNHLDERFLGRLAVLLHEHELAIWPPRENGDIRPRRRRRVDRARSASRGAVARGRAFPCRITSRFALRPSGSSMSMRSTLMIFPVYFRSVWSVFSVRLGMIIIKLEI